LRYRLATLMILLGIGPPIAAYAWWVMSPVISELGQRISAGRVDSRSSVFHPMTSEIDLNRPDLLNESKDK